MSKYTCPMHASVIRTKPGHCPDCGMELVLRSEDKPTEPRSIAAGFYKTVSPFMPLIIIFGIIVAVSFITSIRGSYDHGSLHIFMITFMAGFFLVFGGIKLLDLKGFVAGFTSYDVIAQNNKLYAYLYPFLELALGFTYVANFFIDVANSITFVITVIGSLGIIEKLRQREVIQCACLGTFLKLPLTKVSLAENVIMGIMAATMILGVGADYRNVPNVQPTTQSSEHKSH